MEVLSPAGNMEKLKTAIYFGADAVYFSGKNFGLRSFAGNFSNEEIREAVKYCHKKGVKAYITLNIVAHNSDFLTLEEYLKFLNEVKVDAVIVSDMGIMTFVKKFAPDIDLHVSTQANITNKFSAKLMCDMGAKRIVLARELSLNEIKEIRDYISKDVELEAFVHGAMCISYSGRCLLSNYLTGRESNKGACVQACRWGYTIHEVSRKNEELPIEEDERGTYILNSKDLNMIEYIDRLENCGVTSLKIEGRMKSSYYVATTTNAYKRAVKYLNYCKENNMDFVCPKEFVVELFKSSHRQFTTGFNFKDIKQEESEYLKDSMPVQTHEFMAIVSDYENNEKMAIVEQRNRFCVGDTLEILSPHDSFNKQFVVEKIVDEKTKENLTDAKFVQQRLIINCPYKVFQGDILRKKVN